MCRIPPLAPEMLFRPLDRILSTPAKVRVLRALLPLGRGVSGREVARRAGVSRSAMHALDELVDLGLVTRHQATGQHLYSLNRHNYFADQLARLFESEGERREAIFEALRTGLGLTEPAPRAGSAVLSVAVFGSAARGEAGPASDFDLLVVTDSDPAVETTYDALSDQGDDLRARFGLRLSPVVLTLEKLRARHAAADPFVTSAVEDAVRVYGPTPRDLIDDTEGEENA
ncbi:MAG TPA: nucleotidyltransferase domain-containing protein [Longimicrobiaceae bacterium]|nr:nucleotidyltransferase domain-containing protein [Longimicrobiaceae bacterium]